MNEQTTLTKAATVDASVRVYISGPMTGLPEFNYPAFKQVTEHLRKLNWTDLHVECPTEIIAHPDNGDSYEDCLREALWKLLRCNVIVTLPGWQKSTGAQLEYEIAVKLGFHRINLMAITDKSLEALMYTVDKISSIHSSNVPLWAATTVLDTGHLHSIYQHSITKEVSTNASHS